MTHVAPDVAALALVHQEMKRQVEKWGEQDHPSFKHTDIIGFVDEMARSTGQYAAKSLTHAAKQLCDGRLSSAECSWQDILNEEVLEARDEAIAGDMIKLQEELIQIAAVALSWHNSISRNGK